MKSTYKIKRENLKLTTLGFTLIELIAVLVILAILALIVTPLVMSIIRKARISADKRSIDAYGRSVELAIANYLLDNGDFPTEISQLTIEYSGDRVECSTTQLNSDSSVYLAGCTVGGRNVDRYTYGTDKSPSYATYTVGDEVTYNNVNYYVIKDSGVKESIVTLLKVEPLTVEEVNLYGGVGTANNHVNMYVEPTAMYYQQANDSSGYGGMNYINNSTCGYVGSNWIETGCTSDYNKSDVKYVIDNWSNAMVPNGLYEARLITYDELINDLGYDNSTWDASYWKIDSDKTPSWIYGVGIYWTMSSYDDLGINVWFVKHNGGLARSYSDSPRCQFYRVVVRPVIVLDKSVLSS